MATYRSDPLLVQACLDGKEAAWTTLVDRYGRLVFSVPRRHGLSETDAEDVMQAVFVALYQNLERLKDQTKLSAWLITTAHRETWRVGKARGMGTILDEQMPDVSAPADDQIERWELQDQVRRGLSALGGRCEELLRALYLRQNECDYQTVSGELGMPLGSIGPTRARCLKKLEAVLLEQGLEVEARLLDGL